MRVTGSTAREDATWLDARTASLERTLLETPDHLAVNERHLELQDLLAATLVRRQANQHGCREASTGAPCGHPDHRRDRYYAGWLLEALGLPSGLPVATDADREEYLESFAQALPHHGGRVRAHHGDTHRRWNKSNGPLIEAHELRERVRN